MGATTFTTVAEGRSAKDAFRAAVDEARHEHGNGGYTGTIAEKRSFNLYSFPDGTSPFDHANKLLDQEDGPVADKWGPAGCFYIGSNKYLFFGWAST